MQYDILLSGGRVIDPAQGIDGALDVAIQDGRVAAVQAAIPRESAKEVLDVSGKLVLAWPHRHPRPRVSVRHWPLRPQR